MLSHPTLVVVSGPPGSGKTTLAHQIAREVGCPAICRDEIKEGMVQATPGFVAGAADELSTRTLRVFFGVIELLLRAGVTTVAEAAFQDRLWRPGLEPLQELARIRVVHCMVAPTLPVPEVSAVPSRTRCAVRMQIRVPVTQPSGNGSIVLSSACRWMLRGSR